MKDFLKSFFLTIINNSENYLKKPYNKNNNKGVDTMSIFDKLQEIIADQLELDID